MSTPRYAWTRRHPTRPGARRNVHKVTGAPLPNGRLPLHCPTVVSLRPPYGTALRLDDIPNDLVPCESCFTNRRERLDVAGRGFVPAEVPA